MTIKTPARWWQHVLHGWGFHFGQHCTYEECRKRPDKSDPRVWCRICGYKSPKTLDDMITGKNCERFNV